MPVSNASSLSPEVCPATHHATVSEAVKLEWYIRRVESYLLSYVSSKRRKQIVKELRTSIAVEAETLSVDEVLVEFGAPECFASAYVEGTEAPNPNWLEGIIMSALALVLYWSIFLAFAIGMFAVVDGSGLNRASAQFLFMRVFAFSNSEEFGITWDNGAGWIAMPVIAAGVAFVLSSRLWKLIPRLATTKS